MVTEVMKYSPYQWKRKMDLNMNKRVLVAMSGGVDSSVAAFLLKKSGYDVIGVTMQLWDYSKNVDKCNPNTKFDTCCSTDDVDDARIVANKIGIPFYVIDYQKEFKENVVDYFIDEYLNGKTPNPCVACNTFLKFDLLMDRANKLKCNYVATGHYADIQSVNDVYRLYSGKDKSKDQSYFLYALNQENLRKILFPLAHLQKSEVRRIAEENDFVNAQKKDSMEICFVPNNNYAQFIKNNAEDKKIIVGSLIHENGAILGKHDGIHKYTVGQRKGLGISSENSLFVTRIDNKTGDVFLGEEHFLQRKGLVFKNYHQIRSLEENEKLEIKVRYRSPLVPIILENTTHLTRAFFSSPQKSISPGQIAVVYSGTEVIGGGYIDSSF